MQPVDFWCSRSHYVDHTAPIWHALPQGYRGRFQVADTGLVRHAASLGIKAELQTRNPPFGPIVFCSRSELRRIPGRLRPMIFAEHGCGQTYEGHGHLPPMPDIVLVVTNPSAGAVMKADHPHARVVATGPVKLDSLLGLPRKTPSDPPCVAVSHHWDQLNYPETRSAWPWDKAAWEAVVASGRWHIIGHAHPADGRDMARWWASLGVEVVEDFAQVIERADMFACDNSSTLYEFAALDRPVVVLSPPYYRRDVDHGLRFWSHVPGAQVSRPEDLPAVLEEAWADSDARATLRREAVEACYGRLDGQAAQRAARAIVEAADNPAHEYPPMPAIGAWPDAESASRVVRVRVTNTTGSVIPRAGRIFTPGTPVVCSLSKTGLREVEARSGLRVEVLG